MTPQDSQPDRELAELESQLGAELTDALRAPAAEVPERADRAVRAMIAGRSAEIRRGLAARRSRLWPAWAAAAALVVALGTWTVLAYNKKALPGDVDGSGRVDIVDAYLLARRLQTGDSTSVDGDLTGDGRVDGADVKAIARKAVALAPEGK